MVQFQKGEVRLLEAALLNNRVVSNQEVINVVNLTVFLVRLRFHEEFERTSLRTATSPTYESFVLLCAIYSN